MVAGLFLLLATTAWAGRTTCESGLTHRVCRFFAYVDAAQQADSTLVERIAFGLLHSTETSGCSAKPSLT